MDASWTVPVVKELARALDDPSRIRQTWDRVFTLIMGRGERLAFTGLSGVGKTVLFDYLTGAAFKPDYSVPRTSRRPERGILRRSSSRTSVLVVPGQESPTRNDALDRLTRKRHVPSGIVHVVANGYISLRDPVAEGALVERGIDTVAKFRDVQRQLELEDLTRTLAVIRQCVRMRGRPRWMLVVATKVDLYASDLAAAQRYYSPSGHSPFVERIRDAQSDIGRDQFDWAALPACARLEDFTFNGESTPTRVNDAQRNALVMNVLDVLGDFYER